MKRIVTIDSGDEGGDDYMDEADKAKKRYYEFESPDVAGEVDDLDFNKDGILKTEINLLKSKKMQQSLLGQKGNKT